MNDRIKIEAWPNGLGFSLVGPGVDTEVWIFDDHVGVRNFVSETWLRVPTSVLMMGRMVGFDFPVLDLPQRCADHGLPLEV